MNQVQVLFYLTGLFFIGTALFFLTITFFGKIIMLQMKIWFLAKKGYVQIDHVGDDRVHRFFYLRPSEGRFDIQNGTYVLQQDAITKVMALIKRPDNKLGKDGENGELAEDSELSEIIKSFAGRKYNKNAVTLRWGIPTIEYHGDDPMPIVPGERNKLYSAGIINNVILKILTMKNYKLFQKWLMIGAISLAVIALALIFIGVQMRTNSLNSQSCLALLNASETQLKVCLQPLGNMTSQAVVRPIL